MESRLWTRATKAVLVVTGCVGICAASGAEPAGSGAGTAGATEPAAVGKQAQGINLGAIVVTARRTERGIGNSFASVTVIGAEEIMKADADSVPEVLAKCEGIHVDDGSGVGTSSKVNMRGFATGMSAHHLVLVDGVPQNSFNDKLVDWNLIPLADVERIEVVRGPLSTLYGENAMSGVINIITKQMPMPAETMLHASYGSYNTLKMGLRANRSVGPADYTFTLGQTTTDGYRDYCDAEYRHVTGKLGVELDECSQVKSWFQYSEACCLICQICCITKRTIRYQS